MAPKYTVMIIDDDAVNNTVCSLIINRAQFASSIQTFLRAGDALDYLRETLANNPEKLPDVIFLDINMPVMNGWEFLEAYKVLDEGQKSKIVIMMLTTSLNPWDRTKAEKISAITGFQVKPLSEEMLREILQKYFPEVL